MDAITLSQPWAHAMLHCGMDLASMAWQLPPRLIGKRVMVYAGRVWDRGDWLTVCALSGQDIPSTLPREHIVGSVVIVDWARRNRFKSSWFFGPVGVLVRSPLPLDVPIPCRGRPQYWTPRRKNFKEAYDWVSYRSAVKLHRKVK